MIESEFHFFQIEYNDLIIPEKHIGIVIGYLEGCIPDSIKSVYKELENQAGQYCEIKGGLRIITPDDFKWYDRYIEISGQYLHTGKVISSQIKGSEFIALFACTIGPRLEKWANRQMEEGDGLRGYLIDLIGSETVELATDLIETELERKMQDIGLSVTNRFSPGYCGWPMEDQRILFSLLPDKFCGISLTPAALMLPIKSVNGIIGIGVKAKKGDYPCRLCDMTDCIRRVIHQIN